MHQFFVKTVLVIYNKLIIKNLLQFQIDFKYDLKG